MIDAAAIRLPWETVGARLDERGRRLFAAAEVRSAGRGGLALVSKITGLARSTINRGQDDLDGEPLAKGRVRRAGGGRRSVSEADPELVPALAAGRTGDLGRSHPALDLGVEKHGEARGGADRDGTSDPRRYGLARSWRSSGSRASPIARRMKDRTLPTATPSSNTSTRKSLRRRPANSRSSPSIRRRRKKELLGNFKNGGTDYRAKGDPR